MRTSLRTMSFLCVASAAALAHADAPITVDASKLAVCTDGKAHYVAVGPHEKYISQLYYGDGKIMSEVMIDPSGMLSGTDFLDPRFPNPTANDDFRGLDMRVYSSVDYDKEKKTCSLRCGDRTQALTVMGGPEAAKLMGGATFQKSPRVREPYALARDDRGTYYYVDRGLTAETKSNFRVFVGKKGALKLQKMKDVASDSEGEVFSTASGDLRFVTAHDKKEYTWLKGGKSVHLVALPPRENLTLIYTTLGVYTGQKLGTPCDDQ